jgi:hypothetical protein
MPEQVHNGQTCRMTAVRPTREGRAKIVCSTVSEACPPSDRLYKTLSITGEAAFGKAHIEQH